MKSPLLAGAIAASAVLAVGCGSSKKSAGTTTGSTQSAPAQSVPATTPEGGAGSAGQTVTLTTKTAGKLGSILAAGPKRLTVYLFEADKGSTPTCTGACASVWPPLKASASAVAATGTVKSAMLGVVTRPDGVRQVTYNRHPLYFYTRDGDKSDAYGQAIKSYGASWYVVAPSGKKVDTS